MRPTWHLVTAENIRWMLKLSEKQIKSDTVTGDKYLEITEKLYSKCNSLIEKMLAGNRHLMRSEIAKELSDAGISVTNSRMIHFMMRAEAEGIVCSGIDKGNKQTYALLEERAPLVENIHKDDALAKLATMYFQSHSPASLNDFVWWSGLSVKDSRQAMDFIMSDLIGDKFENEKLFIHKLYGANVKLVETMHLLPSYDEYLISYKDRTSVLSREHYPKAFNNYGIFNPVIFLKGKIIGKWGRETKKKEIKIETSFFENDEFDASLLDSAIKRYTDFIS